MRWSQPRPEDRARFHEALLAAVRKALLPLAATKEEGRLKNGWTIGAEKQKTYSPPGSSYSRAGLLTCASSSTCCLPGAMLQWRCTSLHVSLRLQLRGS